MSEGILAIHDFKQFIGYQKEGTFVKLFVSAVVDGRCVYEDYTNCRIAYDVRYRQYTVDIDWIINDSAMHALGLYSRYNTNYQGMVFNGKALIIQCNNYEIRLHRDS